jgi:hypothetical protein
LPQHTDARRSVADSSDAHPALDADAMQANGAPPEAAARASRRAVLAMGLKAAAGVAGLGLLAGCASSGGRGFDTRRRSTLEADPEPRSTSELIARWGDSRRAAQPAAPGRATPWRPLPDAPNAGGFEGVLPRSAWAKGEPIPARMDRMLPIRRITVHHDGMGAGFTNTSRGAAAERLEAIRRAHVNRRPAFGDIGYHYIIDPAGRVWQGRPLAWQGAHVGGQNHGNIGICMLGNFEQHEATNAQLAGLERFIAMQMRTHRINLRNVHSHRELAATACPGRLLQPRIVSMRSIRGSLANA